MNEAWKPIKGFPDYEISSHGRVRSSKGRTVRILKPKNFGKGYLGVVLCGASQTKKYLHHLVLEAFVGPRPVGADACHNDGVRTNNRLDNLRWDSREGNFSDKTVHGTLMFGSGHANSKLSETDVLEIRRNPNGLTQRELAREFGVSQGTVSDIVVRKTWTHLP